MECLTQQASEKIDRTRAHAGEIFLRLLYMDRSVVRRETFHLFFLGTFYRIHTLVCFYVCFSVLQFLIYHTLRSFLKFSQGRQSLVFTQLSDVSVCVLRPFNFQASF